MGSPINTGGLVVITPQATESALNFISGSGISVSTVNNPATGTINITIGQATGQAAQASLSAVQSIPNSTNTVLLFNSVALDPGSMYNAATGQFTIPVTGLYLAWGQLVMGTSGSGLRGYSAWVNGVNNFPKTGGSLLSTGTLTNTQIWAICVPMLLAAGDLVTFVAFQSSGGAINAGASSNGSVVRVL